MSLVTVVIPVYNGADFIAETVQCVLDQTFRDFELVILDNASADQTVEIVSKFQDSRIRLVKNATNIGAQGNWNLALDQARGKYFKLLCADDLIYPSCLKEQVAVLEAPENVSVSMVSARRDIINFSGNVLLKGHGLGFQNGKIPGKDAKRWVVRSGTNMIGEPSVVLLRSELIQKAGRFDGSLPYLIDLDYWFKLLDLGDLYAMPETLGAFRVSAGSWSASLTKKQAAQSQEFFRKHVSNGASLDFLVGSAKASAVAQLRRAFYVYARWMER